MSPFLSAAFAALRAKNWMQLAEQGVTVEQAMCLKSCDRETASRRLKKAHELLQAGSAPRLRWHLETTAAKQVGLEWQSVPDASKGDLPRFVAAGRVSVADQTVRNLPRFSYYADPKAITREARPESYRNDLLPAAA
jgi:hypothetical protein